MDGIELTASSYLKVHYRWWFAAGRNVKCCLSEQLLPDKEAVVQSLQDVNANAKKVAQPTSGLVGRRATSATQLVMQEDHAPTGLL